MLLLEQTSVSSPNHLTVYDPDFSNQLSDVEKIVRNR
tara:strand:- start:14 stop:124 length:111 start_codon:yes stop_codon:yes gene_type:complete